MSVPLPESMQVGPYRYRIVANADAIARIGQAEQDVLLGHYSASNLTITVDPAQADDMLSDTLAHETLHALIHHAGLTAAGAPLAEPDADEQVVNALAPWLLMWLRNNPELVAHLTATTSETG